MEKVFNFDGNREEILHKILSWADTFPYFCLLTGNNYQLPYGPFPNKIAVGQSGFSNISFEETDTLLRNQQAYFGYFGYDLKNQTEKLESKNPKLLPFPEAFFLRADHTVEFSSTSLKINSSEPDLIYKSILEQQATSEIKISAQIHLPEKNDYMQKVNRLKQLIYDGEIYEANLCIPFSINGFKASPIKTWLGLNKINPTPFAGILKNNNQFILSFSPERFIKKESLKIISQPMKGTAARGRNANEDEEMKNQLCESEKEKSENMMIVDLVRNDLTRSAEKGTIKVEELFGVYTFPKVHQMVSTITAHARKDVTASTIIKNAFPMGSMTGAPKIRAMQLIDEMEGFSRGPFSGCLGYFDEIGNFDFNVLIRSLFIDTSLDKAFFSTGSAITYDSVPEKEFEECMLKASFFIDYIKQK